MMLRAATSLRSAAMPARFSTAVRSLSTAASAPAAGADAPAQAAAVAVDATAARKKFKNHFKRASSVMGELRTDAWSRMQLKMGGFRPALPAFDVGDAVEIQYASEHTETDPVLIRGTVIAKTNKGIDSKFTILNAFDEEWYTATYPYSSPLLRTVRVMMKRRFSQGTKRPHRAKLFHLKDRDPTQFYFVDHNTKEASEIQAEKEKRKAVQKSGKVYKKEKGLARDRENTSKGDKKKKK